MIRPFSQCSIQDIVEHLSDIIGHPRLHPDECLRNDDYSGVSFVNTTMLRNINVRLYPFQPGLFLD